ncbi:hypothetical protein FRACYDRAFT_246252 [Fragilariopsis cylindrus CCMP1102]|uniref:Methyltransferase FkbM domain-containing protein n=1 Tax=Fragilariopsis cylindrus CCMP1102 TaxID=635003 RepID=A0A1E7EYU6_9STRA|nr:hypothetical protein FRACYDRAFT_246252 [Fragilariopsis cylindrus CCMP1102]|eukprot:OEU11141.1 hypothetical protein FRACYDRAFT_246252 [Fragilariopsis cylindrus CCMP1102]
MTVLENLLNDGTLELFKTTLLHSTTTTTTTTDLDSSIAPPIYVDFGLSDGKDTKFHLSKGYSTVSVDAYTPWIDKAKNEFHQEIKDGHEDSMDFYFKNEGSVIASFEPSKGCQGFKVTSPECKHIKIPVVRCETIIALIGMAATFVKVDVEMLHHSCVRGLSNLPTYLFPKIV